jgi:multidrug efflux pump subunit AcrA (membrane-fusion protein)
MQRYMILPVALAVALAVGAAAQAQMVVPVSVDPVVQQAVNPSVDLSGVAEPRRLSTIGSEVAGRVEKMALDAGDFAAAGATICQLRRLPVELQLKSAQGMLDAAKAQLAKAEQGFRQEEVQQADARFKAAQAAYEKCKQDNDRTIKLFADGASTTAEREAVEAACRMSKEQLAEAEAGLALVKKGMRKEDIDAARAQVDAQTAAVEALKDSLAKMTVTMPFDGFVTKKLCEEGEWLSPGMPVAQVADLGMIRIQLDVPERYLAALQKDAKTLVMFDALGKQKFTGTISQIVPQSAGGTHTVPVRVDVPNVIEKGRPTIAAGLLARVALPVGAEHQALLVPKAAIIRQSGRDLVYTLTDVKPASVARAEEKAREAERAKNGGKAPAPSTLVTGPTPEPTKYAVAIPVTIVQGHQDLVEVRSDSLKAGMSVVTRGTYLLAQDTAVQVYAKEGTAPAAKKTGAAE